MGGEKYFLTVEVDSESYQGSIHDSISHIIYRQLLEEDDKIQEVFGVYQPTRLLTEGEDSGSWYNTEDWAITGSQEGGTLIIGQSISCREKPSLPNGVPRDVIQLKNFERRIRMSDKAYQRLDGLYSVGVNCLEQEVQEIEKEVEEVLKNGGTYDLDLVVRELEKGKGNGFVDDYWDSG